MLMIRQMKTKLFFIQFNHPITTFFESILHSIDISISLRGFNGFSKKIYHTTAFYHAFCFDAGGLDHFKLN